MDKREHARFAPPAVGGASLLVAFAVLCLTVFALLSLSTVRADDRLSQASAQAVENYYAADLEAQEVLARLRAGELPPGVGYGGDLYTYECPISETQTLQVEVFLRDGVYTVLRWQAVANGDWEIDEDLHLWDGSM